MWELITSIPDKIGGGLGGLLVLTLVPLAWKVGKGALKKIVAKELEKLINKVLHPDSKDPVLKRKVRALGIAAVDLAEYVVPDRGKGDDKFKKLERSLEEKLGKNGKHLAELIKELVYTADDTLDEKKKDNG